MSLYFRNLDNTAKAFSLDEKKNSNTFRISAYLFDKVDPIILHKALIKSLEVYPFYNVKLKKGFFWLYFVSNDDEIVIKKEKCSEKKRITMEHNNKYLFRVNYNDNRINLDIYHLISDGKGASIFFKEILANYFDLKYNLNHNVECKNLITEDPYLKYTELFINKKKKCHKKFKIIEKSNFLENKNYFFTLDLSKVKEVSKNNNATITEYLTALYIYTLYNTIYIKSNKDIVITIPIDLRKYYNVETLSNFFTCMEVEGNVINKDITFDSILKNIKLEFKTKLTDENIRRYLSKDVKLGTNIVFKIIPRYVKKASMKYFGKIINNSSTSTLSNVGPFVLEEQYKKYVDNIFVSVNAGAVQRVKCTICSYENKLNIIINSNLVSSKFEEEFYKLLKEHFGNVIFKNK